MISEVSLETFKCFEKLHLPLAPLTVLTGFNGGGKSTVLQSLLLVHQSLAEAPTASRMLLSGPVVLLGTLRDVVDKVNGSRRFGIGVRTDQASVYWTLESQSSDRDELSVPVQTVTWTGTGSEGGGNRQRGPAEMVPFLPEQVQGESVQSLVRTIRRLRYVPADRIGPAEVFPLEDIDAHDTLGRRAERSIGTLYWYGLSEVSNGIRQSNEARPTLMHQVEAWLNTLFPGVMLDVQRVRGANLVTLGIRTSTDTDFHRPQHVGFGITHVLPVLVACLASAEGDLVLIENPEAHLHPRAQAELGRFLARVGAAGRQVVVETHSDHILNGARRAVQEGIAQASDVVLHFFRPRRDVASAQIVSLRVDQTGAIDHWPEGFFDQIDKDTMALAGV
jgi:predicted ATPase